MENNRKLEGVWKNNAFKVKIKEDAYVNFYKKYSDLSLYDRTM